MFEKFLIETFKSLFNKKVIKVEKFDAGFDVYFEYEKTKVISEKEFDDIENKIKKNNSDNLKGIFFKLYKVSQEKFDDNFVEKLKIIVYNSEEKLLNYLKEQKKLQEYDHRIIGKEQELFEFFHYSPGSVFWLPNGWKVFRKLENFIRKYGYDGFQEVKTPAVMSNEFWIKSGHMDAFKKNMAFVNMGNEQDEGFALKPMNCPAHIELFDKKTRSYRDLPVRLAEFGSCFRYEPSGSLHGLMRVRSLTIDDGHIFCSKKHIENEVELFLANAIKIYKKFGFEDIKIILATRPEGFLGNIDDWDDAETRLENALKKMNLDYQIAAGDGAFYGPKIEMHVKDSMKRSWQLGTIQLDFVLPKRFDISYDNEKNEKELPCMLHRAILGSIERFIGVLLEHTKGKLPLFLAPCPIVITSVVSQVNDYVEKIFNILTSFKLDVRLDLRSETLGYKIRQYKKEKIPIMIIIGKVEKEEKTITVEYNGEKFKYEEKDIKKIMGLFDEI